MGDFLLRGLNDTTLRRLKERAERNGRSLQQEMHDVLDRSVQLTGEDIKKMFDDFDAKHGPIPISADEIVDMIREERDIR